MERKMRINTTDDLRKVFETVRENNALGRLLDVLNDVDETSPNFVRVMFVDDEGDTVVKVAVNRDNSAFFDLSFDSWKVFFPHGFGVLLNL